MREPAEIVTVSRMQNTVQNRKEHFLFRDIFKSYFKSVYFYGSRRREPPRRGYSFKSHFDIVWSARASDHSIAKATVYTHSTAVHVYVYICEVISRLIGNS